MRKAQNELKAAVRKEGERLQKKSKIEERLLAALKKTDSQRDLLWLQDIHALTLVSQGRLREARKILREILQTYEKAIPPDDPDLLRFRSNLADTLLAAFHRQGVRSGAGR